MKSVYHILKNTKRHIIFDRALAKRNIKKKNAVIPLYSKEEIIKDPSKSHAKAVSFIIGQNKPTVFVCPGGAYQFISLNNEGENYAKALNDRGYNVFMVNYRTDKYARYPSPMEDLARCIQYAKEKRLEYNINTDRFYICGSSAGGHLCAYFAARYSDFEKPYNGNLYSLRPSAVILSYPVISMTKDTHELSRTLLLGSESSDKERHGCSVELIADKNYPPVFFWHCEDDKTVPVSNSIRFDERLNMIGVPHRFIKYPSGGHGIGLADGTSAEGWISEACKFIEENS